MTTPSIPRAALGAAFFLCGTGAAQPLPEDWRERDLEGRWVVARAALDTERRDDVLLELASRGDDELLEWLAIYASRRGTQQVSALGLLARDGSPRWPRVAAWLSTGSVDSHQRDEADARILANPHLFRSWYERYRPASPPADSALMARLGAAGADVDVSRFLPPIEPAPTVLAWLDAPPDLPRFGSRLRAEPGVRYLHQVVRGIDGMLQARLFHEPFLGKLARLGEHADEAVRVHALQALAALPPAAVPVERLLRLVDQGQAPSDRALATRALGQSDQPQAFVRLVDMLATPEHPGWRAAVRRIGDVAGPVGVAALQRAATTETGERRDALRRAWTVARERLATWAENPPTDADRQVASWLERAALLERGPRAAGTGLLASALRDAVIVRLVALEAVRGPMRELAAGSGPAPVDPALGAAIAALARSLLERD